MFPTSYLWEKAVELWHLLRDGDLSETPRWMRTLVHPLRVSIRAIEEFLSDKCLQRASALAFASLLALVPVTIIFFFFFTKLQGFSEIQLRVEDFLFQNLVPTRTDVVRNYLSQYTKDVTFLGVFGIATLFITAIFLFNTIEHTINDIWHAKQKRPFLSKFTAFWTVLTAAPVLALFSFYVAARLTMENSEIMALPFFSQMLAWLTRFFAYFLNWLAFWFLYQFVPYTQVRFRAAFVGGVVAGTLWQLAKGGFNWYITTMTAFDKIYGPLGTIPVFLLWLYLTWLIVLLGAEVAYAVQYPRGKTHMPASELDNYLEFYSVRAMAEIVKRFNMTNDGSGSTLDNIKDVGIPGEILGKILNRLAEKRLILYTEDKNYVPARQPSSIMIREVVEAVSGKKMLAPESADDTVSMQLRKIFGTVAADVDLALNEFSLNMLVDGVDELLENPESPRIQM